jgi:hypothetical protein
MEHNITNKIWENFYYEDVFCSDISELMWQLDLDEEHIEWLPDDWKVEVMGASLEKMFTLTKEFIVGKIMRATDRWEERFPEDSDRVDKKIQTAIETGIDTEKINELIPSLYYPNDTEYTITKADLIEWCKPVNDTTNGTK